MAGRFARRRERRRFESATAEAREQLAAEMEDVLRRHVMQAWFPRCIDRKQGGYFPDFDRRWRLHGSQPKMLEFQARQVRAAARLALAYPGEGDWAEYAVHGYENLRTTMWDATTGGWYWMVERDGRPSAGHTKHAHSTSYAVQSCALVYVVTGDAGALEMAEEGLRWFDQHAHDDEHGGYHSWLLRDGAVVRRADELPPGTQGVDPLNHDVGLKNENVHGDWLEALFEVRSVSSLPLVEARLREIADIHLRHITTIGGEVHHTFHDDWTPQPCIERFGYGALSAHRLLDVGGLPGYELLNERAKLVLDHTIRQGWRKDGGLLYAGPPGVPVELQGTDLRVPRRAWWVQLEAIRALAMAWAEFPGEADRYWRRMVRLWDFFKRDLVDDQYGGIYEWPTRDMPLLGRPIGPRNGWASRKGHSWKDASHDVDCLLRCIRVLREGRTPAARPS